MRAGPIRTRPATAVLQQRAAIALGLLASFVLLAAVLRATPSDPLVGDGALTGIYTLHASRLRLDLGAYSRFRWHHPGPLLFYLAAPLYAASGYNALALRLAALALNVAAALMATTRAWTRGGWRVGLPIAVALLVFAWRVPALLPSLWNPHVVVVPLALLIVAAADLATGGRSIVLAVCASLVAQAHVGLIPVTVAIVTTAFAIRAAEALLAPRPAAWHRLARDLAAWLGVSMVLWLPALVEQARHGPEGNLAQLVGFFARTPSGSNPAGWSAFVTALSGSCLPAFALPTGQLAPLAGGPGPTLVTIGLLVALVTTAVLAWSMDRFVAALALVCLVACAAGGWSIMRIPGEIGDHAVFWVAMPGVLAVAIAVAGLLVRRRRLAAAATVPETGAPVPTATVVLFTSAMLAIGIPPFLHGDVRTRPAASRTQE